MKAFEGFIARPTISKTIKKLSGLRQKLAGVFTLNCSYIARTVDTLRINVTDPTLHPLRVSNDARKIYNEMHSVGRYDSQNYQHKSPKKRSGRLPIIY